MIVIYNFIATFVSGIPLEKGDGVITYSNVLSIDEIKSSIYLLILFKLTFILRNGFLMAQMVTNLRAMQETSV